MKFFIRKNWTLVRTFLLISWVGIIGLCCAQLFLVYNETNYWLLNHKFYHYNVSEEPRDPMQRCHIPVLHPFAPSIIKYVSVASSLKCRQVQHEFMFIDNDGYLRYNDTAFEESIYSKSLLTCNYAEVLRDNVKESPDSFKLNTSKQFTGMANVSHADFVKVSCKNFIGILIYSNILIHIRKIPSPRTKISSGYYNVMLFGIDSLSRQNAMRQLPKTYSYLRDTMKSEIFKGYVKVGSNTFPNLATLLVGVHPEMKSDLKFLKKKESDPHDFWPFIWKNYSSEGYRTFFAEDYPKFNIFHHGRGGFIKQPTDHYIRTFWQASDSILKFSTTYCFGSYPRYQIQTNYVKNFIQQLKGVTPFWGISLISEICHNFLNTVGFADDGFVDFLKEIYEGKYLDDTIFVFFSDHGNRMDTIRQTYIGSIEDYMPLFTIYLPNRIRSSNPDAIKNLKRNTLRLTSAFDVYCTLVDILQLSKNSSYKLGSYRSTYGVSLFAKISPDRTCKTAGIDDSYCICQKTIPISTDLTYVKNTCNYFARKINENIKKRFHDFTLCAKLYFDKSTDAHLILSDDDTNSSSKTIKVLFSVLPSGGIFQGTATLSGVNHENITIIGTIERTNKYGHQSHCISDQLFKPYCYCN